MKSFSSFSSSSATVRVDKATSHLLIGPDWTMNMDICDAINNDQWQAKEVLKAVKKRLQNKNPKVQFLALTLLETIVKNCGDYVQFQVAERNILQEMIKIVRKKTDMQVRDKILVLLDSWQEAFGGPDGKYPQYYWAYIELKRSGIVFPQRSANTPPIFTPPVTHSEVMSRHLEVGYDMPSSSVRLDEAVATDAGNMSLSDFNRVRDVMELLREVLQAVNPHDRGAIKDELIVELVNQCRANQKKLMQLLSSTRDEKLLGEGLELNDSLQSLLAKHEAMASGTPLPAPAKASKSLPQEKKPVEPPIRSQFEDEDADDEEFAQLAHRNSKLKQVNSEGTSVNSSDLPSPNRNDITTVTESSTSSSAMSNALVPLDPPPPVKIRKEEQDMIDLLSITLSAYPSSPHTPMTPSISSQHGSSIPATPNGQGYSHNFQPFYPVNQGYTPYNSYVAPWAQQALPPPQPQPQLSQYSVSSPSWAAANANPSSFQSTAYQFPSSHANSPRAANLPAYSSRPLQHYNSFGSRVNGSAAPAAAFTGEIPANANLRQSGTPTSPKPYVLPNRLFEDLIDLRSRGTGQKISTRSPLSAGTSNQPMIGGKK